MKLQTIILYILAVIFLALFLNTCREKKELQKEASNTTDFLNDTIRHYKNELGQEIAVKTALQGEKGALEVLLSKQIDSTGQLKRIVRNFRTVDAAGNIITNTRIDTIKIGYEIPVPCEFHREWEKTDPFYSIAGTSSNTGITINSLEVPNTLSFAIGKRKKGWFNSEYVIEAVNSNPNIKTLGLDSYSVKVPKKRFGVSLFAGYGLGSEGLTPLIGIGVGYNLIEF